MTKSFQQSLQIFTTLFAARVVVFAVGVILILILEPLAQTTTFGQLAQETWGRWDTRHYLSLASEGYTTIAEAQNLLVFFPFYPLLICFITQVTTLDSFTSGLLISWTTFGLAGIFIYKMVRLDFDHQTAVRTLKYLAIFPVSFFFGMVYTESLFLLIVAACFFALRKQSVWWAVLLLFLASLTRLQGVLLIVPALVELGHDWYHSADRHRWTTRKRVLGRSIVYLLASAVGIGTYLILNQAVAGNWIEFITIQRENWHATFTFIIPAVVSQAALIGTETNLAMTLGTWLPQTTLFFVSLALIAVGYLKKIRLSYLAHWLLHLVISFSSSWLLSGVRFMLPIFSLYLVLALLTKNRTIDTTLTILLTLLLSISMVLFLHNAVF